MAAGAAMALHALTAPCSHAREPGEQEARERDDDRDRVERSDDATERAMQALDAGDVMDLLARDERPDRDERGFPVKQREVTALDLPAEAIDQLEAMGFRVLSQERLSTLNHDLVRLLAPKGMNVRKARAAVEALAPAATTDLVHYYGLGPAGGPRRHKVAAEGPAPGAQAPSAATWHIGMIDTDVASHPALNGTRVIAWKKGHVPGAPVDHGTAVASILAQFGQPTIHAANIFRGPSGRPFTSADVLADALEWMAAQDATVINLSLAGPRNAVIDRLLSDMIARGRTIVAAAGNGGPSAPPAYPAALPGVIAVTAVDKDMRIYRYANRGAYIDVAAQGVDILAARAGGGMTRLSGTSFATPRIATWLALCRAGGAMAQACRQKLERSARDLGAPGRDDIYGFGVVD